MLYACVQKFDVTGTVENFLGTKQGLTQTRCSASDPVSFSGNILNSVRVTMVQ